MPIFQSLGATKAAALSDFHGLSGADNTGSFSGKGKLACWKVFSTAGDPNDETIIGIEKFVCYLFPR